MKILVTGATGFVGKYLLNYLRKKLPKAIISATGRNLSIGKEIQKAGFEFIAGDLAEIGFIRSDLQGFTHIVHAAAHSSIWGKYDLFYKANVSATINLLSEIKNLERFIFISTANIYFNFRDRLNVKETDPLPKKYISHYPATKLLAEKKVLQNMNRMHAISLRPRGIIGPGDTTSMPRIIKAYKEGKLKIVGDGKNIVDFTSVENLSYAVFLSLSSGLETNGQAYNITDGSTQQLWTMLADSLKILGYKKNLGKLPYPLVYSYAWLIESIAKLKGANEPALTRYAAAVMKVSFTLSIDKARKQLSYKPQITSTQCIDEFLKWAKLNSASILN